MYNRTAVVLFGIVVLVMLKTVSFAYADSIGRSSLAFELVTSFAWFNQEHGFNPICCGESDEWTAFGPRVGIRSVYQNDRLMRFYAEVAWGFLAMDGGASVQDIQLHNYQIASGLDREFELIPSRFSIIVGTGTVYQGYFGYGGSRAHWALIEEHYIAQYVRLGALVVICNGIGIGIEVDLGKHLGAPPKMSRNYGHISLVWPYCVKP